MADTQISCILSWIWIFS